MEDQDLDSENRAAEISPFEIIEDRDPPSIASPALLWALGIALCLAACGSYLYFIGVKTLPKSFGIVAIASIFMTATILAARRQRRRFEALLELLSSLNLDLDNLRDALEKYLLKLDKRADRFFNSMTPSESALRYFLTQIAAALTHRVEKVNKILSMRDRERVAIAYRYLQAPLKIKEGVVERQAKQMVIPLKDLRGVCSQYIAQIEQALGRIEKERAEKDYDIVSVDEYYDDSDDGSKDS